MKIKAIYDVRETTPNAITAYFNCGKCLKELPANTSPAEYANTQMGITNNGQLQVWCNRHDVNVAKIDLQIKGEDND